MFPINISLRFTQYTQIHNGQPLEVEDASALDQCMDNAFGWSDFLGIPHASIRATYAKEVAIVYDRKYWQQVSKPFNGCLVVWGPYAPLGIGVAGHIGIYDIPTSTGFQSFDQNWTHRYCEFIKHTKAGVIAYLAPLITGDNMESAATFADCKYAYMGMTGVTLPDNDPFYAQFVGKPVDVMLSAVFDSAAAKQFRDRAAN